MAGRKRAQWHGAKQTTIASPRSYSYASSEQPGLQDLHSINFGATTTLHEALMLGIALTYNGKTGTSQQQTLASALPLLWAWGGLIIIDVRT